MIRFNIAGKYLDLYADTNLQFMRKNILFAFDAIEVSRSAAFDVPASPTNNAIFEMANDPAKSGTKARQKLSAQMQYSGGVESGYLYISTCTRERYSCVFVFGSLLALKTIKEAGSVADILAANTLSVDWSNTGVVVDATPYNARQAANNYCLMRYKPLNTNVESFWYISAQNGLRPLPSVSLAYLTNQCASELNVTITKNDSTNVFPLYRLVQPQLNGANGDMKWEDAWGGQLWLKYNLPDVDFVQLLKIEALLQGRALFYGQNGIEYVTPDFSTWTIDQLQKIVELKEVERVVSNLAQKNLVFFDSNKYVKESEKITEEYDITNEVLEEYKNLFEIPFSEGGQATISAEGMTRIAGVVSDFDGNGSTEDWEVVGGNFTLLYCGMGNFSGNNYLSQPALIKQNWFENVCTNSTMLKVQAVMTLREYNALQENHLLNVNGQLYVWTEAQWSEEIVTLSLNKVTL